MDKKQKRKYGIILCLIVIVTFGIGNVVNRIDFGKINAIMQEFDGLLDIINIIISFTSVFSIILLYRQIKAEHEKSRREKTVDLLVQWALQLKPETNTAVKIVEKFDKKQCVDLVNTSEFYVEKEIYKDIRSLLNTGKSQKKKENKKMGKLNYPEKKLKNYAFW